MIKVLVNLSTGLLLISAAALGTALAQPDPGAPEFEKAQAGAEVVPALDPELESKVAAMDPNEFIRVLIFARSDDPPVVALGSTLAAAQEEVDGVKAEIARILERADAYRTWRDPAKPDFPPDSGTALQPMDPADEDRLRYLQERHEELSAQILTEQSARLAQAVGSVQERLREQLEALGAEVEFTTVAGNVLVARVPAGAVTQIAAMDDVARVAEDRLADSYLDIADDATRVSSTSGLWNNGFTGGIYDPAVVDSGTDLSHPFLDAIAPRENHWSWYLVAGLANTDYCDVTSGTQDQWVDDLQGHGTHVMGIVASEGSTTYPNYLGLAYGVDKTVHLKAAWLRCSNGRASMYWSDKMWVVDRALNQPDELRPTYGVDEFNDDVDGFNLSYGGETTADDPAGGQFWDAVVDDFADMVVTISAGNSGPSNTNFNDPATSYNAIAVANVDDQNTAARSDDTLRSSSTRGPTASGRRKPDIAAPGTNIRSANTFWESQTDYVDKSGTSMAAPMVLGVAMDLMDAGVIDEKEIKALLINTAQKNEAGINFESDADGWSTAYGWGYMNAWAAYYHRSDVRTNSVTPRNTATDYDLWKGQMRDEGSGGEGRDRATLVWNRHATYVDHEYPSTAYGLNDLNLRLYNESNGSLIDSDLTGLDNVHQVRVNSGAGTTDVVVKVYAWSTSFNAVSSEAYALATEEGFSLADPPAFAVSFDPMGTVNTGATFTVNVDVDNTGDVASFNNTVDLTLPTGFSVVSGTDPQNIGTVAAGSTGTASWTVRASTTTGTYSLRASNSSTSYAESYSGSGSGSVTVAAVPVPSPPSSIAATDGTYTDRAAVSWTTSSGATSYRLYRCTTSATGSCGSPIYTGASTAYNDYGATPNTIYYYRATACNTSGCSGFSNYNTGYRLGVPSAPSSITASDGTYTDRVAASWSSSSYAASYQLYRCTTSSTGSCGSPIYTGASTTYNDTGATRGVAYYYRAKGCNAAGCSAFSSYDTGYRACPASITLANGTETGTQSHEATYAITVGPNYTVANTANLTLTADHHVRLTAGVSIQNGAQLTLAIQPGVCVPY